MEMQCNSAVAKQMYSDSCILCIHIHEHYYEVDLGIRLRKMQIKNYSLEQLVEIIV